MTMQQRFSKPIQVRSLEEIKRGWTGEKKKPHEVTKEDVADLWRRYRKWAAARIEERWNDFHRPRDLKSIRLIVSWVIRESGMKFTEEEISKTAETFQKQLDEAKPIELLLVSERELDDEIERARARGEYVSTKSKVRR